jgi:hypothetical protein
MCPDSNRDANEEDLELIIANLDIGKSNFWFFKNCIDLNPQTDYN